MAAVPREVLNKETNARFWAQTHYRPGQKLSQDNPTDRAMMPVWMDIFHKVEREAKEGRLVLTYDRPEVAQGLADAEVADKATVMHLEAAARAPDVAAAQQDLAAATTAAEVSAQKVREAAAAQPPTVSPQVTHAARVEAARVPPPPQAPPAEHLAHARTQSAPMPPSMPPRQPFSPREIFVHETNQRFWTQTGYKPGQKLDMSIPKDREMSKVWMSIFQQVQHEASTGRFAPTRPQMPPQMPPQAAPMPQMPPQTPPMAPPPMTMPTPPQTPAPAPTPPTPWAKRPEELAREAKFAEQERLASIAEQELARMRELAPLPEKKPFPVGKAVAIAAAIAAAAGLAIVATRKPARTTTPRRYPRAPRVFLATPTLATRARIS